MSFQDEMESYKKRKRGGVNHNAAWAVFSVKNLPDQKTAMTVTELESYVNKGKIKIIGVSPSPEHTGFTDLEVQDSTVVAVGEIISFEGDINGIMEMARLIR